MNTDKILTAELRRLHMLLSKCVQEKEQLQRELTIRSTNLKNEKKTRTKRRTQKPARYRTVSVKGIKF